MNPRILLFSCLLLLAVLTRVYGKRHFGIYLKSVTCITNSTYLQLNECRVNTSVDPPLAYFDVKFKREISDPRYTLDVILRKNNNELYPLFNTKDKDVCEIFEGKIGIRMLKIASEILTKSSNLPKKCPIEKDYQYVMKDAFFDPEAFPPYFPEAAFIIRINCTSKNHSFVFAELVGEVKQKSKKMWG